MCIQKADQFSRQTENHWPFLNAYKMNFLFSKPTEWSEQQKKKSSNMHNNLTRKTQLMFSSVFR